MADASAASLHAFVTDQVEPGARVRSSPTAGWAGYRGLEKLGYVHDRRSQTAARTGGDDPSELLPAVHRVAPRWANGGCWAPTRARWATLPVAGYRNEFAFRFNRRRSRSRGMVFYRVLECAVAHGPVRPQAPAEPEPPSGAPPMENSEPRLLRFKWIPQNGTYREGF